MHAVFQNDKFSVLAESSSSMRLSPAAREEAAQLSPEEIFEQLSRMLSDDLFMRSERLSRFLRFIVEQALAGRACELNQYAVGLAVFDKPPSFDPNVDPIVRVEAGRLRAKLREYHATSGQADRIRIGMAKSGYLPVFKRSGPETVSFEPVTFVGQGAGVRPATGPSAQGTTPAFGDKKIAIAVLPFSNLSRDAASDQFCRELSDRMSKELARLTSRTVRVVDPIVDAESGAEISEIGRRYNAEVVLEGSLQTVRKQVRIFSMLARTVDAYGIWADSYDGSFDDLCSPRSNTLRTIAEDVAKALQSEEAKIPVAVA